MGIRAGDLLDPPSLLPRLKQVVEFKNTMITRVYGEDPVSLEEVYDKCVRWGRRLGSHLRDTQMIVRETLGKGHKLILEGPRGPS